MKNLEKVGEINFPVTNNNVRCLMMPFIQGDISSIPSRFSSYFEVLKDTYLEKGDIGFLTIDESFVEEGQIHRGDRSKFKRAIHTEAGKLINHQKLGWGHPWAGKYTTYLEPNTRVLIANNIDDSCVLFDHYHEDTSDDGDIGHCSSKYPYEDGIFMKNGEVYEMGLLTPHESLPLSKSENRKFLRIVSSGVTGREEYFTKNPLMENISI